MHGIADYEFVGSLGSGSHGQCFVARRPPRLPIAAEFVAVKVLFSESTADTFRRATRQLKAAAAVASPHLVELYDAGQHDGVFYYSMAYVAGGTLAGRAAPIEVGLRAIADAARGLAALHAAGIAHAAVKPSNVLLVEGGARLADPGLAEVFTPGVTLTGSGPVAAVEYADPELLRGAAPAPHHDVWSLGAMVHRVAGGGGLYGELSSTDGLLALRQLLSGRPEVSPALSPELAGVVRDCLAAPGSRPSADEVAQRVSTAVG